MVLGQELKNEIATTDKDILHPAWGGLLRPQDDTLLTRGGGKGLKIYDEIERDCHAYAVLQKRKMAVAGREWRVDAASSRLKDRQAAEWIQSRLTALPFDQVCLDLLDALLKGFSVAEMLWEATDGGIVPAAIKARDQRRFVFAADNAPRLLTFQAMLLGEALPARKFIVHSFGAKDGNPYGLGLGARLFWPVFFKRQGIQFWLTFADKFGSPTAVGKYPSGTTPTDQKTLLEALGAIAQDAGVVIPEGMSVELLEAARSGTVNTYESLCRYMDEEISKAVLGETLSTSMGQNGARAASETHNAVRLELTRADADLLSNSLNNTLIRWLTEFNFPNATAPRLWWAVEEAEDLGARATRDKTIVDMGFKPTLKYIHETYGGEWTETAAAPAFAEDDASKTIAESYADQLGEAASQAMDGLIEPVRRLVATANSLEEVRDGLLALYAEMDVADLAAIMQRALAAAELAGRYEAR